MHSIRIHKVIALMISFFYLIGLWHRGDKPTVRELRLKLFYCIYYFLFFTSFAVGAITNQDKDTSIFLGGLSFELLPFVTKVWILIWKQNQILDLVNRISVFSIRDKSDFIVFNDKLGGFMKFVIVYVIAVFVGGFLEALVLPLLGSEKSLFFEIWFPFDYKNSDIAFWMAIVFIAGGVFLTITTCFFSTIIWYLLSICSLRYKVLGSEVQEMGRTSEKIGIKLSKKQLHDDFSADLKAPIDTHVYLSELTDALGSFFSKIFFVQFITGGLCTCVSIYCLAFDIGDNLLERLMFVLLLFYISSELFMITYLGNEIMLSSNRLSYSLFESDWYDQPQSTKKSIIIFGEYLKKPQVLIVGKLFPLTLETFTRILNSAYSMFNILKNFKE